MRLETRSAASPRRAPLALRPSAGGRGLDLRVAPRARRCSSSRRRARTGRRVARSGARPRRAPCPRASSAGPLPRLSAKTSASRRRGRRSRPRRGRALPLAELAAERRPPPHDPTAPAPAPGSARNGRSRSIAARRRSSSSTSAGAAPFCGPKARAAPRGPSTGFLTSHATRRGTRGGDASMTWEQADASPSAVAVSPRVPS